MWNDIRKRYENELAEHVIPFWEKYAIDRKFGGYFTSLDRDGSVYDTTKYMWMQWRIVYMFCELWHSKFRKNSFLDIAAQGFEFLYSRGRSEDGSYFFALNREGDPVIAPYNVYSDCFAAMGAAGMYRATGEKRCYAAAREAMESYLRRTASGSPAGRWDKSMPARPKYLSLGYFMMIANLALVMKRDLGIADYDADGIKAANTILDRFYDPELRVMFENVPPGGGFDRESCQGRMLNPGHVLESMWFLLDFLSGFGDTSRFPEILNIIQNTLDHGWDREYGGIFYFMDALGKPHLELQHDMKLWWVHNEAIIATLSAYRHTGDRRFLEHFRRVDAWTFSHFPDPEYGEWFGYLDRRGEPTHLLKGGKWKTFFHLPRCLLFSSRIMEELERSGLPAPSSVADVKA